MPLQCEPGEYFPIVRQLEDPTDSTTRYLRAYIRKKKGAGEVLLDTVNMIDEGGQRFTYYYQCPQDSDPYYLNIIIKVFDDSGYTTESTRYTRTEMTVLAAIRWGLQFQGGGAEVNYDKIRRIAQEEIEKIPKIKLPERIDLGPLLRALKEVNNNIQRIEIPKVEIPKQEKPDFGPVVESIKNVQQEIKAIPQPERVNFSPITEVLEKITDQFSKKMTVFAEDFAQLKKGFQVISKKLEGRLTFTVEPGKETEQPKKRKRSI